MERKTTALTEPLFASGEVHEVEKLLQFLHERGDARSGKLKPYEGLPMATWTAKPWWQFPLFARYTRTYRFETFGMYKTEPIEVIEPPRDIPRRFLMGIDTDGALLMQVINGRYPHFLRVTPTELRRYDDAVFQTVRYTLRYLVKQDL